MAKNRKDRSQGPEVRSRNEDSSGSPLLASRFSLLTSAFVLLLVPRPGSAHPMGNFSISHYAGIRIERDFVELDYFIDMAEIPTFQEIQQTGIVPKVGDPSLMGYLEPKAETLKAGLVLEIDGRPLRLRAVSEEVIFPPGAGGLPTMKLGFVYRAALERIAAAALNHLAYRDRNFPERMGWKEVIVVAGPGIRLVSSSVPDRDRSVRLTNYPTDLVNSPPQVLEASASFETRDSEVEARNSKLETGSSKLETQNRKLGSRQERPKSSASDVPILAKGGGDNTGSAGGAQPASNVQVQVSNSETRTPNTQSLAPNRQATPRNRFTELIATRQSGFWFLLTAALIAAGLGALHALEPGHGKTIVASYLVGMGGTAAHACLLGLIVTASHTAGVYLLGAATLYASRYVVPDQLYPWLGAASGIMIAGLGVYLFARRCSGDQHGHAHGHHHAHAHGPEHTHEHGHVDHHASPKRLHIHEHPLRVSEAGHNHDAGPALHVHDHPHEAGRDVSYRQLLVLGVTGGMVPCPAALVVLLSAVALHRIAFGLFLIVAFSMGLAGVLISIGLMMVYAGRFMARLQGEGPLITRWLPLTSAAIITVLGVTITVRSLASAGILAV